jgi:glycosyltransferase involved in cell wall biosynthesis
MQGGVGAFTERLAEQLSARGHEIHVVTSRAARPANVQRGLWDIREPYDLGYAQLHPRARRWWWGDIGLVADVAHRFELDVVNLQYQAAAFNMHVPAVNFLPWRLRGMARTVVTFHDLRVPYLFPKAGALRERALMRLARSADGVIVTNSCDEQQLLAAGLPPRRLARIPIGSNLIAEPRDPHKVSELRRRLGLKRHEQLIGYFGFLSPSKGADVLVRALARLPGSVHLAFIGATTGSSDTGSSRAFVGQVETLIDELQLAERVHWSGFVPDTEASTYFHTADVMVMPYRDGVSLRRGTLMAILAHGRPLVTTEPSSPVPELSHGHNVLLTRADDVEGLEATVTGLLADENSRQRLAANALELAGRFSWPTIAEQSAAFYRAVCRPPG